VCVLEKNPNIKMKFINKVNRIWIDSFG